MEYKQQGPGRPDLIIPGRPLTRRRFLALSGGALAGVTLSSLLAACGGGSDGGDTEPNQAQTGGNTSNTPSTDGTPGGFQGGGELKILLRSHYIPAYDEWFDKFAADWGKANNVDVKVDHIQAGQLAEKIAAEVAAQAGHDIIGLTRAGEAYLFADHLVDVSDLAEEVGGEHGGWTSQAEQIANVEGVWRAMPDYHLSYPPQYRKDLFDEIGMEPNSSWEDLIAAGEQLKAQDHPIGIAINQKSNDANSAWLGLIWSFGATYVAEDGKTVTVDSPEMRQALEVALELYNKAMTNEVLSWADSENNRFLASGRGSWIMNPISALRTIEKENPSLAENVYIATPVKGPKGAFASAATGNFGIMSWSKNADAAKALLREYYANWLEAFKASEGYNHPFLKDYLKQPMPFLGETPKLEVLQTAHEWTFFTGYPGPPTVAASEVENNWLIPLMIGTLVQTGNVDEAIQWGHSKVKEIYDKHQG